MKIKIYCIILLYNSEIVLLLFLENNKKCFAFLFSIIQTVLANQLLYNRS